MKKFLVIFLLGWMLAGCGIGKVSFAVETPTPTKHTATEVSLAPTETPLPEPTVIAPAPTPDPPKSTATAPQTCVAPRADALFSAGTMMDFPQAVLNFMNQGGTAKTLAAGLQTLGFSNPFGPVAVADFTGDGYLDLAVSLMDPAALDQPPLPGVLEIFVCLNGAYFLAYDQPAEAGYTLGEHLWLWQDLNADGAAELVMSDALCGASTCFDNVKILVWDGNTFTNRLADRTDRTDDLPNPKVEVADLDGDRIFDLVVTAGGISSAAAGPPRGKIRTWTYDAAQGVWVFAKDTLAPSNFRIHLLHDADTAANQGNDAQALEWYDRVINDNSLLDFVDPETEQANLAAFALYRELILYLYDGNAAQAEAILLDMQTRFPPDSTPRGYVDMALLFRDTYPTGWDAACAAATDFAATHAAQILDPLGSTAFGYGNPDYTAEVMCVGP